MRLIFPLLVMAVCWAGLVATPALAQQSPSDQQSSPSDRPADTSAAGTSAAANAESSASSSPESESSETPESESAQPSGASDEPASPGQRGGLRFRFAGTPWPDVLTWFAEEADLALQLDQAPLGTFTFSDPTRSYTVSEALDVLNLTLMKSGYILVRRGRMLQLIDLEVENSDKMISEIAELVAPEDLEERGKSDVVSSVFALGSMTPSAAKEELAQMIGPWGRVIVLDSARQVKVTETASKLIAIRDLLESTATADSDVIEIVLKHRAATEVLEIARPLLGLEPGENAGEDIRLSVGVYGERIYAAGLPGKTGLLKSIIEKADQPLALPENDQANEVSLPVFRTHTVTTADSSTVFDVLQTLLAGTPDARLAIDPKTEAIIAWARPETHQLIAESISEMEGTGTSFKVLDLRRLDPAQALLTINKFFGVSEEGGSGPVVDGDPESGKLWVRGTKEEIELVEKLLQELEGSDQFGGAAGKVRVLPYTGRSAAEALQQVESLWRVMGRENRIRTFTPSGDGSSSQGGLPERRISREPDARVERPSDRDSTDVHRPRRTMGGVSGRFGAAQVLVSTPADPQSGTDDGGPADEATANEQTQKDEGQSDANSAASNEVTINVDGADIIVQFTPAGLVIASEDMEALDAFQSLLESVATPSAAADDLPTIIWLKYIKAEVAAEMVSSVLGGSESSFSSTVDSVAGGLGGGMLGLLGMGGGGDDSPASARSVLTSTGSVNIVPDPRLNALIVQANPIDMQMIELILEKIDIQESPEDIETDAKPALIPVIYQDASDVADVVKSVFGERIAGQQSNGRGGGGGGGGQPSPQDFINALRGRGGRGGRGDNQATSERTKISVAVDKKSNSLVVIATPQDFQEVRDLVQALDYSSQPSEEIVEIAPLRGDVNPEVVRLALESILGQSTGSTSDGTSSSGSTGDRNNGGGDDDDRDRAAEIRRRIEAFRAMRGGGDNDGGRGGFRGFGGRGGFRGGGGPGGGGPGGRGGGEGGRGGGEGGRGGGGGGGRGGGRR